MPKSGHITPSRFKDVLTGSRGGDKFGKTAKGYAKEIVLDIFGFDIPDESYRATEWGELNEWGAIEEYEERNLIEIHSRFTRQTHPDYPFISGEPDGLVGEDGMIEVKCPWNSINQLNNALYGAQIDQYKWQLQGYLWITGREWVDFISYDPRSVRYDSLRLAVHRVERNQDEIDKLESRCLEFWEIVQHKVEEVCEKLDIELPESTQQHLKLPEEANESQ